MRYDVERHGNEKVEKVKLEEILSFLGRLAPWELAESWDNVGLMIGDPDQNVTGVLAALDPTLPVLEEAIARNCNTIVTHHPLIFHPLKSINTGQPPGIFLKKALKNDIAVISCHTNLDLIDAGVSNALAETIGLEITGPLRQAGTDPGQGYGKIGHLPAPASGRNFLRQVAVSLKLPGFPVYGALPESVERVAVCGGSASDLAETALTAGAQVFITAEVKHAVSRWAEEKGLCIIDAGHYGTENVIIPYLVDRLHHFLTEKKQTAPVLASRRQNSPLSYYSHISDQLNTAEKGV